MISAICLGFLLLGANSASGQIQFSGASSGGSNVPLPQSPKPVDPSRNGQVSGCNCLPKDQCPSGFGQLQTPCLTEQSQRGICCIQQKGVTLTRLGFSDSDFVPMTVSNNEIDSAFRSGQQVFTRIREDEQRRLRSGEFVARGEPARGHAYFFGRTSIARSINDLAYTIAQSSLEVSQQESLTPTQSFLGLPEFRIGSSQMGFQCPMNNVPRCDASSRFRTIDGSCNNLGNPLLGRSNTGFTRLRQALYGDGIMSPRQNGVDGLPLPNVREVSNTVLLDVDIPDTHFTLSVMQWAQFMDHDFSLAPFPDMNGEAIRCCNNGQVVNPLPPQCFPITVSPSDGFYGPRGQRCLNFVRSMLALNANCALGPVEQLNSLTHYIDGSMIYGSTQEEFERVAEPSTGLMKTSANNLPPTNRSIDCDARVQNSLCFAGGDSRINEQPALTVTHVVWVREHNRVARALQAVNPRWSGPRVFEEARRIVVAEVQHFTYKEWLPIIIGSANMARLRINTLESGYRSSYSSAVDPRIANEFATGAFRFGHSLVQGFFRLYSSTGRMSTARLRNVFNSPSLLQNKPSLVDEFVNGLTIQNIQTLDNLVTQELSNHLFQTLTFTFGMDLMSLNHQRGREHAIATYNQMREDFGPGRASGFLDLQSSTSPDQIRRLQAVYRNVDDIDLFSGGMTERPLQDAILGPTFAGIIGRQFQAAQNGDRFFYDMGGQAGSFTPAQLQEIRKSSYARVYCDNSGVSEMQPAAFRGASRSNPRVSCSDTRAIPTIDFSAFKE